MRRFVWIGFWAWLAGWAATAQNTRVDGYKGIWYTIEQASEYGDKYSGGLGTYTADHNPVAIYSAEANKTFFLYGGTPEAEQRHLLIMASYYDHATGQVPKPVVVCDKQGVDDPHDNASLAIDGEGFLWVFVSGRNVSRLGKIYKSRRPYDIGQFDLVKDAEMTYPQPWWMEGKGFLQLFTRYTAPKTRGRELYWSTSRDGKHWTKTRKLAGIEGHYQLSCMAEGRVMTAFNYHPTGLADTRTNLYVLQTDDWGKTWKNMQGEKVRTPLTQPVNAALVYDCKDAGRLVYLNDMTTDEEGNPVVLAIISNHFQPGPKGNPREWWVFHWKDGNWKHHKVCESTHNYDMGSIYVEKDVWRIIGPTEPGPQFYGTGGEVAMWISRDQGRTWTRDVRLTQGSTRNHSYVRRPLQAHPDFYAFWADGDADRLTESHLYFTNQDGSGVWELPYRMTEEMAYPTPVAFPDYAAKRGCQPFGVNLAGAEFDEKHMPGEHGRHYYYPTTKDLTYFRSKGFRLVRLPFKWERMQPQVGGELDTKELERIQTVVREACSLDMQVILDLHNYGRRYVDGEKVLIGSPALSLADFADFWQKFSGAMKTFDNIYAYGLMNEPHDMEASSASWAEMAQRAILAIRTQDVRTTILVGGNDWSSAERWVEQSDGLKHLTDPCANLMFEAHVYFDADGSGAYKKGYDGEQAYAERGVDRVRPFVEWLQRNGFRGLIGEYGVPDNDDRWLACMDQMLAYLQREGVNATYWAGGSHWGRYPLRLSEDGGHERPQMRVVRRYLYTREAAWVDSALQKAEEQALRMARVLEQRPGCFPRSANEQGDLVTSGSDWWCSGFFPGTLWQLYGYSHREELREQAVRLTRALTAEQYNTSTHDLGFMLYCSFGQAYRLTPTDTCRQVLLQGARSLASRYHDEVGCILSWKPWGHLRYPVIIDNMMNLELLMWAYGQSGDERFRQIAIRHADKTLRHHFRPDGSSYHVVSYNPVTGEVEFQGTNQGCADSSAWARGQAWALYGYTMMYRETGEQRYLDQAQRVAAFLLNHPRMPDDWIPYWDFDTPTIPDDHRDSSAAAVMASALLELADYVGEQEGRTYFAVAERQLKRLASVDYTAAPGTNAHFILMHGVGNVPQHSEIDKPLSYGDYYYVEALLRYAQRVGR